MHSPGSTGRWLNPNTSAYTGGGIKIPYSPGR
jgi:hypothetical protein